MTTSTSTPAGNTQHGNYAADGRDREAVPTCDLDAIGRRYDRAKADIADGVGALGVQDVREPWPATEAIDVRMIKPPAAAARHVPGTPATQVRPWRPFRRWIARRSDATP